jgi:hypothetical protein
MNPIAVTPKVAFAAIGVGNTKGYELIGSGKLEAVKIGRATRVIWSSVEQMIETAPRVGAVS